MKKFVYVILVFTAVLYFCYSFYLNKNLLLNSGSPYFNYLTEAFVSGRLNVYTPLGYDLSQYQGKLFLYWGPGPFLFILPFYILLGKNLSDILYTVSAGALNIILFYLVTKEAVKKFKLKLSKFYLIILILNFSLASPNFYLSLSGRVWHTSQIISITYLLFFLFFYFKFLNNFKSIYLLLLAAIFFNLAWVTRYILALNIILFFYPVYLSYKNRLRILLIVFLATISTLALFGTYNFLRFDSPFENGLKYQNANSRFAEALNSGKEFSVNYIPYNSYYYFLNLPFLSSNTRHIFDPEGLSIFAIYPALIALIFFFKLKKIDKNTKVFLLFAGVTIFTTALLILMYFGTGWTQFGSRYFFDVIPLLFLLLLFVINKVPKLLLFLITFYGTLINIFGTNYFYAHF